ncbi:MAG: efflux RND transporter periplasmic adaptor subunit [Candidatus Obscuribacterales bacterium]|nr:efflux RND transporter periplasmic adaptor subunit [Candidatus Obscuribacterales bacterium]
MKFKLTIPLLAITLSIAGAGCAAFYVAKSELRQPEQVPARKPFVSPFVDQIAGVGIVESKEKNIRVAPFFSGRVENVLVKESMRVVKGQPLYKLNSEQLESELDSQLKLSEVIRTKVDRLHNEPRNVDVSPLEAIVQARKARLADVEQNLARYEGLYKDGAVSENDTVTRRYERDQARAMLVQAESELKKLNAGAWHFDIEQSKHELSQAMARAKEIQTKIEQCTIRSPMNAEILQVNVRPGEYVRTDSSEASIILGSTETLQVRVDIDEINASRIRPNMKAIACIKGNSSVKFPLKFIRVEPYMVPKRSLTGNTAERNDVRVLQLLYEFKKTDGQAVYVGEQLEVFLSEAGKESLADKFAKKNKTERL